MPGVIMESGSRNGSHTNHDRDQRPNGVNGGNRISEKTLEKGKGRVEPQQNVTPISPTIPNGIHGGFTPSSRHHNGAEDTKDLKSLVNQLPPEIIHITHGYVPVSKLLSRLAQKTQNDLSKTLLELADMPLPSSAANGNSAHTSTGDDNSPENLNKKLKLLKFAQDAHTEFTKALVITNWSRRSEDVGKLIDLKVHLDQQKAHYDFAIHEMSEVKRGLTNARLPNPDLKTAVGVLTTGKAAWMPDLGFIPPPPLTAKDLLKSLENLNTLLSIRLNIHDHDSIPIHFMDYSIKSGRVTFKVEGEFEVDLTIADENPESQFWFIDFRFLFTPSLVEIPLLLRTRIENSVNAALSVDGLMGCYKFLHGMVLSHKITEYTGQAFALASGRWVEGLKVERLNRAMSIQYWLDRFGRNGPKSWIILGVHSGKRKTGNPHPKDTPQLFLRWFRDSKEVKEVEIPLDTVNISAESLLKTVIARHIGLILISTYDKLKAKPLFANDEAMVSLSLSEDRPAESELKVQLTSERELSIKIEPVTGRFIFGPASPQTADWEFRANRSLDPATELHNFIDSLRQTSIAQDIVNRSITLGWISVSTPALKKDDLKVAVPKDTSTIIWLRRSSWIKNWYIAICMGTRGERWFLIETTDPSPEASITSILPANKNAPIRHSVKIANSVPIPIKSNSPLPTYTFFTRLHVFTAALMSHHANLKSLHERHAPSMLHENRKLSASIKLPSIYIRVSSLIKMRKAFTKDVVKLTFQGLEAGPASKENSPLALPASNPLAMQKPQLREENILMVTEARINILVPEALKNVREKIDRDIAFDFETGSLAMRLRSRIGEPVIPKLIERTIRVFRLVEFVKVLQAHEKSLRCELISLGKITFTYGKPRPDSNSDTMDLDAPLEQYKAVVDFSAPENVMTLILEEGNPHLIIHDFLNAVLNGKPGLNGVATFLPLTLPVVCGLEKIELAWSAISKSKGEVFVLARSTDWYEIRYNLLTPLIDPVLPPRSRKIKFELKLSQRRGFPWWYLKRTDERVDVGDDLDAVLKSVWNSTGNGWQGMRVSGVGQACGIEELLMKVDEAVRKFVGEQKSTEIHSQPIGAPRSRPRVPQQRLQQPTPNNSQSQGRNNYKQEIVEID